VTDWKAIHNRVMTLSLAIQALNAEILNDPGNFDESDLGFIGGLATALTVTIDEAVELVEAKVHQ
jgi:hypothetical protein